MQSSDRSLGCVNVTEIQFCREVIDTPVTAQQHFASGSVQITDNLTLETFGCKSRLKSYMINWLSLFTKSTSFIWMPLWGRIDGKEGEWRQNLGKFLIYMVRLAPCWSTAMTLSCTILHVNITGTSWGSNAQPLLSELLLHKAQGTNPLK